MQEDIKVIDISVISDFHLATHASKAKPLLKYLKSIHPSTLVLNGDIIDSWRFSRSYFPKSHLKVIRQLLKMIEKGVQIVYITGNHDDVFRKFNNTRLGNFSIVNQLELDIKGQKTWIFHGDVFDHIIHHSPWLAKLGAAAYGFLTIFNKFINVFLKLFSGKEMILYKSMKDRISKRKEVLTNFEKAIANAAISKNIDLVICGHTHVPVDKRIDTDKGSVRYINCGDWVEHFSAAECIDGEWSLNYYHSKEEEDIESPNDELFIPDKKQLYKSIVDELAVAAFSDTATRNKQQNMKILYAIQGTGNGHLARATEIVPLLKSMAQTDVLVSGTQADLKVPFKIDYQFSGLSFIVGKNGGVDLWKTIQRMPVLKFFRAVFSLPVEEYDLVISDFEPVSAWACRLRNKECIGLSHQNAVLHPSAPKPEFTDWVGKLILKHYAPTKYKYGFNFKPFSPDIFPPVIRHDIRNAESTTKPHYTVYLPAYSDQQIQDVLSSIPDTEWQVFSKHSKSEYTVGNIHFQPVSLDEFTKSFLSCTGLVCTAGFEGPAEAIFMGKKLCVIPMKNQYEQYCNAAFLKSMGIKVLDNFTNSGPELNDWIQNSESLQIRFPDMTREILVSILNKHCRETVLLLV